MFRKYPTDKESLVSPNLFSWQDETGIVGFGKIIDFIQIRSCLTEMQKVGDTEDISLLFLLAGANVGAILGHFWAILGHFWAILGHFWAIFWCLFFVAKYCSVLFKSLFATLNKDFTNTRRGGVCVCVSPF